MIGEERLKELSLSKKERTKNSQEVTTWEKTETAHIQDIQPTNT